MLFFSEAISFKIYDVLLQKYTQIRCSMKDLAFKLLLPVLFSY